MTEPTVDFVVSTSVSSDMGSAIPADSSLMGTISAHSVAHRVRPVGADLHQTGPEIRWLASDESRRHEGHWVALDARTGEYLGRADTREDVARCREREVSFVFVEPHRRRAR